MYMELEEIINALKRHAEKEKGLKNKILYEQALNSLIELNSRKNEE